MKKSFLFLILGLVAVSSGCVSNVAENQVPYQNLTSDQIRNQSVDTSYRGLLRSPEEYKGELVHVEGDVSNTFDYGSSKEYLIKEKPISTDFISINVYKSYVRNNFTTGNISGGKILEDDYLEVWGVFEGVETREGQIFGRSVENEYVLITARYIDHDRRG